MILVIFYNCILKHIISKRGVLLAIHNFSDLKNLANDAKIRFLLKFQLVSTRFSDIICSARQFNQIVALIHSCHAVTCKHELHIHVALNIIHTVWCFILYFYCIYVNNSYLPKSFADHVWNTTSDSFLYWDRLLTPWNLLSTVFIFKTSFF